MAERLLDRRWPWLLAAVVILLVFFSTFIEIGPPDEWDDRPVGTLDDLEGLRTRDDVNVLFVMIDTLRADRLGGYGYARDTSPGLDRLAGTGIRFAHQLAQSSWTKASMASLWSGFYPARTGINRLDQVVPPAARMPAEIFQEAGFYTAGIYRNGWVAPNFGFDQGFDVYTRPSPLEARPSVRRENPTLTDRATDEGAIESALEFLRVHGHRRWFLYVHLMDVHEYLYDLESALFGSDHSDIYDNSIRHTDGVLQVLIDTLGAEGHRDDTLIVVASDHGEAFGERGYEGHAREVYRESTEVPFLISLPFRLEPGVVVDARTRNVDIWPTVLDLLGLPPLEGVDGRSLVPAILASARGEPPPEPSKTAIAHLDRTWGRQDREPMPTVAIVEDGLRYVRIEHNGDRLEQLFDGRADPAELKDLTEDEPDSLERMRVAADRYLASEPAWGAAPTRELDRFELNQLRALGYAIP